MGLDTIKRDGVDYEGADDTQVAVINEALDEESKGEGGDDKGKKTSKDDKDTEEKDKSKKDDKGKKSKKTGDEDEGDDDLSNLDDEIDSELADEDDEDAEDKDDEEEEDDDSEDDDDDDDDDKGKKKVKRKASTVPLWKHQKSKRVLNKTITDLQNQVAELSGGDKKVGDEVKKKLSELSEKAGMDQEVLSEILELSVGISDKKFSKEISELKKNAKANTEAKQDLEFDREFNSDIKALVDEEHGKEHRDKIRKALHRLAFTNQYAEVPLTVIYNGIKAFRGKKGTGRGTVQGGKKGGRGTAKSLDFVNMSDSDVDNLSDEEFEDYGKWLRKSDKD